MGKRAGWPLKTAAWVLALWLFVGFIFGDPTLTASPFKALPLSVADRVFDGWVDVAQGAFMFGGGG